MPGAIAGDHTGHNVAARKLVECGEGDARERLVSDLILSCARK